MNYATTQQIKVLRKTEARLSNTNSNHKEKILNFRDIRRATEIQMYQFEIVVSPLGKYMERLWFILKLQYSLKLRW